MPTPSPTVVAEFFSAYGKASLRTPEAVGTLFHEEFGDHYTDEEVDNQLLDADMARAWYMVEHGEWPPADWQWWR